MVKIPSKPPEPSRDYRAVNIAAVQQKEPAGIRGGLIFIGIVFFLFVAYQIYESVMDHAPFWKEEQVTDQKKFEPPEDVANAFETRQKELDDMKLEVAEGIGEQQEDNISGDTARPDNTSGDTAQPDVDTQKGGENNQPNTELVASPVVSAVEPPTEVVDEPATEVVDEPATEVVVDQKTIIYFGYNSNELPPNAYETLNNIVKFTSQRPDLKITVEGYTDSYGSKVYNKQLSQYRADMVKNYLIGNGIAPSKIIARGRGQANPIQRNATPEGRKQNRRVEIKIQSE
jgi:outer membrane protein OmpA-like peptidoglycan-associated protein